MEPYNPMAEAFINAFLAGTAPTQEEENMNTAQTTPGETNDITLRLEREQDKASLAKELFDLAIPYLTTDSATLQVRDVADVLDEVSERIRRTQVGDAYSVLAVEDDGEDAFGSGRTPF